MFTASSPAPGALAVVDELIGCEDAWGFACTRCGALHPRVAKTCASCGGRFSVESRDAPAATSASRHLRAIARVPVPHLPTGLAWLDALLGGGLPERCCWVLAGEAGAGKSTLAMMIAIGLSARRVVWISNEQHQSQVAGYADRLGLRDAFVYGNETEIKTVRGVTARAELHRARLVVVDSVTGLEAGAAKQLERWAFKHGAAVIAIAQLNAEGQVKGPGETRYEVTMVGRMRRQDDAHRFLRLDKSRHGDDGREVRLVKNATGILEPAE